MCENACGTGGELAFLYLGVFVALLLAPGDSRSTAICGRPVFISV
jgi:hypothetical protein